jgi:putative ABC transport system permease protein
VFVENVKVAIRALAANKLRSALTTLGIIIGVTSVIALISIGNGVQAFINRQFEAQGSNLVFVFPARVEAGRGASRAGFLAFAPGARTGTALSLTQGDAEALRDKSRVPDAKIVAPLASSSGQVIAGERKYQTRIRGTVPRIPRAERRQAALRQLLHVRGHQQRCARRRAGRRALSQTLSRGR